MPTRSRHRARGACLSQQASGVVQRGGAPGAWGWIPHSSNTPAPLFENHRARPAQDGVQVLARHDLGVGDRKGGVDLQQPFDPALVGQRLPFSLKPPLNRPGALARVPWPGSARGESLAWRGSRSVVARSPASSARSPVGQAVGHGLADAHAAASVALPAADRRIPPAGSTARWKGASTRACAVDGGAVEGVAHAQGGQMRLLSQHGQRVQQHEARQMPWLRRPACRCRTGRRHAPAASGQASPPDGRPRLAVVAHHGVRVVASHR